MATYKQVNDKIYLMSEEEEAAFEAERAALTEELTLSTNLSLREDLLAETDWYVIRATETATEVPADIVTYRQALRDITTHTNWPNLSEEDWPVKPE